MFSRVFSGISGTRTAENKTLLPARCVREERRYLPWERTSPCPCGSPGSGRVSAGPVGVSARRAAPSAGGGSSRPTSRAANYRAPSSNSRRRAAANLENMTGSKADLHIYANRGCTDLRN